ncbi:unnamed protein product [Lactuca saligna]|uniref:AB hydrolase-1 domain-containing protein n=1 Tax=Lactuca saligna TaxID=75948 RepID=A0AA35ZXH4_LACSI|nr:unnamed protein product [Lactuca saligna]
MEGIEHKMVNVYDINMHIAEMVTPDLRGYGDTTGAPINDPTKFTTLHVVGDMVTLIDSLGADKVFVVEHDWGALIAWCLCLFKPDKVKALVNLSIHFTPRNLKQKILENVCAAYGDDHYICRLQVAFLLHFTWF